MTVFLLLSCNTNEIKEIFTSIEEMYDYLNETDGSFYFETRETYKSSSCRQFNFIINKKTLKIVDFVEAEVSIKFLYPIDYRSNENTDLCNVQVQGNFSYLQAENMAIQRVQYEIAQYKGK